MSTDWSIFSQSSRPPSWSNAMIRMGWPQLGHCKGRHSPESTILFVGYQAHGTLGRWILGQPETVRILGEEPSSRAFRDFLAIETGWDGVVPAYPQTVELA